MELLNPGQAIAASICPSNTADPSGNDYGYRPAIASIVERLRAVLAGTCWGQQLQPAADGSVQCVVIEATKSSAGANACAPCDSASARKELTGEIAAQLASDPDFTANGLACACEILQAAPGPQLNACIGSNDDFPVANGTPVDGWCYVDPSVNPNANSALVAVCPADARRMIRFVGAGRPVGGSLTFLYCKP